MPEPLTCTFCLNAAFWTPELPPARTPADAGLAPPELEAAADGEPVGDGLLDPGAVPLADPAGELDAPAVGAADGEIEDDADGEGEELGAAAPGTVGAGAFFGTGTPCGRVPSTSVSNGADFAVSVLLVRMLPHN